MARPLGQNVTEVELGSPDYTVAPLNAREKKLLKTPSAEHFHQVFLEAISSARTVVKTIARKSETSWVGTPYQVELGCGWSHKRAKWCLAKATYGIRLTDHGSIAIVEREHTTESSVNFVHILGILDMLDQKDVLHALKTVSTVSVQLEALATRSHRRFDRVVESDAFRRTVHRWIRMKMGSEMRADLAPLLSRYPSDALAQHLHELVVDEVHDL